MSNFTESNGNVVRSIEPLKDSEKPSFSPVYPAMVARTQSENRKPTVPPKPSHNRFSTTLHPTLEERPESRNSNSRVERNSSNAQQELRMNQLPFSYFAPSNGAPKKAFSNLAEDEDLPPVPIPDYTLHFPKAKRTTMSENGENGSK